MKKLLSAIACATALFSSAASAYTVDYTINGIFNYGKGLQQYMGKFKITEPAAIGVGGPNNTETYYSGLSDINLTFQGGVTLTGVSPAFTMVNNMGMINPDYGPGESALLMPASTVVTVNPAVSFKNDDKKNADGSITYGTQSFAKGVTGFYLVFNGQPGLATPGVTNLAAEFRNKIGVGIYSILPNGQFATQLLDAHVVGVYTGVTPAVPEPKEQAMFLAGILAMGLMFKRKMPA
jgi:hypothetical protein